MRKKLAFALLIPAIVMWGFFLASQLGYKLPQGTPTQALAGAIAWTLLFLIIYGYAQGWRSVRLFLVAFVVGKFASILYYQLAYGARIDQLLLRLAGATILAWIMFVIFWPRRIRKKQTDAHAPKAQAP